MIKKVSLCCLLVFLCITTFAQDFAKYQKAAEKGDGPAAEYLGFYYLTQGEYEQALNYFRTASDAGMPESMAALATLYSTGSGTDKDEMQAYKWYRKAAEAGSQAGYEGLADCMRTISGDLEESGDMYEKISNPSDRVCFILGYFYAFAGREDEYGRAQELLKKAAAAGHVYASAFLGITCYEGNPPFSKEDEKAALEYLRFAYEHSDALPMELKQRIYNILSTYYAEGLAGVAKDTELAESLAVMAENMEEFESYPFGYEGMMSLYDYIGQYAPSPEEMAQKLKPGTSGSSGKAKPADKEKQEEKSKDKPKDKPETKPEEKIDVKPEVKPEEDSSTNSGYEDNIYRVSPNKEKKESNAKFTLNLDASPIPFMGGVSSEQVAGAWVKSDVANYSASVGLRIKTSFFIGVGGGVESYKPSQQSYYLISGTKYNDFTLKPVYLDMRWYLARSKFSPVIGAKAGVAFGGVSEMDLYLGGMLGFNYRFGNWFAMNLGVKASYTIPYGVSETKYMSVVPVVGISF